MRAASAVVLLGVVVCASAGCGQSEDSLIAGALQRFLARVAGDASEASGEEAAEPWAEKLAGLDDERESVIIEGGEFSSLEGGQAVAAEVPFYRYTDANGAAHMVKGLYNVPERYRKSAKSLSRSSMPVINTYESEEVSTRRVVSKTAPYNPNRSSVLLYSAEWCGACRKARAFLDKEGVRYDLLDIDADPNAKAEVRRVLGSVRIPLLDINGTYVAGFAPKQIRRALRKSG